MRKFILALLAFSAGLESQAGVDFFNGTWKEALDEAAKTNKYIFVDFYASWCAPCKFMDQKVFPDSVLGAYFNEHFISLKVDAEHEEELLVSEAGVTGYPTLAFYYPQGTMIYQVTGGADASQLLELGKSVRDFSANRKLYRENPGNVDLLISILPILMDQDPEEGNQFLDDYLNGISEGEMMDARNWYLISMFRKDPKDRFFQYALSNFKLCADSLPGFQDYFTQTTGTILQWAIEGRDSLLVERYYSITETAVGQMGMPVPGGFKQELYIYFYSATGQADRHLIELDNWLMTYHSSDVEMLCNSTFEILERYGGEKVGEKTLNWTERALELEQSMYTYLARSMALKESGRKKEALDSAKKAKELGEGSEDVEFINDLIKELSQ